MMRNDIWESVFKKIQMTNLHIHFDFLQMKTAKEKLTTVKSMR